MQVDQAIQNELQALPPGPWSAFGSTVYAGSNVVCTIPGSRGDTIARAIAKLPDILHLLITAHPDTMANRIEELEEEVGELEKENESLQNALADAVSGSKK